MLRYRQYGRKGETMKGKELIDIIKRNNLENCDFLIGAQGYTANEIYVEIREAGSIIFDDETSEPEKVEKRFFLICDSCFYGSYDDDTKIY